MDEGQEVRPEQEEEKNIPILEDKIALFVVGSHVRVYFDKQCLSLPQGEFKKLLHDYIASWKNPIIGHI